MTDIWTVKRGGALHPYGEAAKAEFDKMQDGQSIRISKKNPRSSKHHKLFFAAIKKAFFNWRDTHDFQPDDESHLRSWLLCKAGYRVSGCILINENASVERNALIISEFLKNTSREAQGKHIFYNNLGEKLVAHYPRSISWGELGQKEFNAISQAVSEILKSETGLSLDEYKEEFGRAA